MPKATKSTKSNKGKKNKKKDSVGTVKVMDDVVLHNIISKKFLNALKNEFDAKYVIATPSPLIVGIVVDENEVISLLLNIQMKGDKYYVSSTTSLPPGGSRKEGFRAPTKSEIKKLKIALEKGQYKPRGKNKK